MKAKEIAPLADRMRPQNLGGVAGQKHLLGPGKILYRLAKAGDIPSLILWGPPGCGKTTLAQIIAQSIDAEFVKFSAVLSGVKDIRSVVSEAEEQRKKSSRKTVLFVDEIHRFNKAQQDAFLPHVESGLVTLIGATTENPSFEVIAPLLSRVQVLVLKPLSEKDIKEIIERALKDEERGLGRLSIRISEEGLNHLVSLADGDARFALNVLETAVFMTEPSADGTLELDLAVIVEASQRKPLLYDKTGEEHYNIISAFHKSLRGSDPDAALYWLMRMLVAGEDPLYICRRMIRFASEDIGNADPQALHLAIASMESYHRLGSPEGELALAQAALYLATAPKSNSVYEAFNACRRDVTETGSLPVPLHIRNSPTRLMKELGYGKGYKYAHNFEEALVAQEYLPSKIKGRVYYRPSERGLEKVISDRLRRWREYLSKQKT